MSDRTTDVVVIGGSLVGLSASLFLAWRGVRNIVVEKHRASSPHPRAMGFTERTLEFYRAVGVAERIPTMEPGARLRRRTVESLAGRWHEETLWTPGQRDDERGVFSPSTGAAFPQDKLEPILRARAQDLGSEMQLGVTMVDFAEDADGVTVHVRDRESSRQRTTRARYLVAADGGDSTIREKLGIARKGVGYLRTVRSVLFRCPEADAYLDQGVQQFEIEQPDFRAFLTTYHDGRWVLMFTDDEERTTEALAAAVRRALGKPMEFEILTTGRWELKGLVADRYAEGRVFLAGDAAHQLPPTRGGFGANTGIDDAYNLAWKLALVIDGKASPKLLGTYDAERQPIGWLRHQQTFARLDYARFAGDRAPGEPLYDDIAMELGQLSRSYAIADVSPELPPAKRPDAWAGQPGVRAPHAWITKCGERISSLDLFTRDFALVTEDARWFETTASLARTTGVPIDAVHVGEAVVFPEFERAFGVGPTGASLVRPDGIIAWRATTYDDAAAADLGTFFTRLLA